MNLINFKFRIITLKSHKNYGSTGKQEIVFVDFYDAISKIIQNLHKVHNFLKDLQHFRNIEEHVEVN